MAEARLIEPDAWVTYWPNVSNELDKIKSMWETYWTKEYIYNSVMSGGWQAWGFGHGEYITMFVLTQIIIYPTGRVLQVMLAFGNSLKLYVPLMEATFERLAMETGCQYCDILGRPGWEHYFPRFKRVGVLMRCRVPNSRVH
jgi:hypothetical protein